MLLLFIVIVFGAHVLMIVLTAVLTVSGYDVMKFEFGLLPLEVPEDSTKLRTDDWLYAKDDVSTSSNRSNQLLRSGTRQSPWYMNQIMEMFSRKAIYKPYSKVRKTSFVINVTKRNSANFRDQLI